jgi:hypothetical protein
VIALDVSPLMLERLAEQVEECEVRNADMLRRGGVLRLWDIVYSFERGMPSPAGGCWSR